MVKISLIFCSGGTKTAINWIVFLYSWLAHNYSDHLSLHTLVKWTIWLKPETSHQISSATLFRYLHAIQREGDCTQNLLKQSLLTQQPITGTQQPIPGTVSHLVILLGCPQRIPHHSSSYGLILQKFSHCTSQKYSSYPSLLQITSVVWFPDPSTVRKGLGKWPTLGIAKHWIPPWAEVLQFWLSQK